jgi:hypothetical protein
MKPNTLHYVLTVKDSITFGRHLFPCASSQQIAFGTIHTFIMNYAITNTLHEDLGTMLRRIMAMWHLNYDEDPFFSPETNPHVPDISTVDGLFDLMAVGNILELANVIDHRSYNGTGIDWLEQGEMGMARWRYRKLQVYFAKRYVTLVGDKSIYPISIFRRSLVEFAAAVIVYKRSVKGAEYPKIEGCTRYQVERKMIALFEANYPELLPALHSLVKKEVELLYWTGPPITIRPWDKKQDRMSRRHGGSNRRPSRQLDFDDRPIFLVDPDTQAMSDDEADADLDGDVVMKGRQSGAPILRRSTRRTHGKSITLC